MGGSKTIQYIKLLRVKHWVKNLLILVPFVFRKMLFNVEKTGMALLGMLIFSLVASCIYIINDLKDIEQDRNHAKKRYRPLASGAVSKAEAIIIICLLLAIVLVGSWFIKSINGFLIIWIYVGINIFYSFYLKNVPIADVVCLAAGFVIRVYYGAAIGDIIVSKWLLLLIIAGSLYLGFGKRRNELKQYSKQDGTRKVLQYYTEEFLDRNMYVAMAMANVFYALWAVEYDETKMIWTVPIFLIIMLKYSFDLESGSDGDPVDVLLHDKTIITLIVIYGISLLAIFTGII